MIANILLKLIGARGSTPATLCLPRPAALPAEQRNTLHSLSTGDLTQCSPRVVAVPAIQTGSSVGSIAQHRPECGQRTEEMMILKCSLIQYRITIVDDPSRSAHLLLCSEGGRGCVPSRQCGAVAGSRPAPPQLYYRGRV